MRPGDWVILDLPKDAKDVVFAERRLFKKWRVVEYPVLEDFFGFDRDAVRLYHKAYGELICPKKYLTYDNYPKMKLIKGD